MNPLTLLGTKQSSFLTNQFLKLFDYRKFQTSAKVQGFPYELLAASPASAVISPGPSLSSSLPYLPLEHCEANASGPVISSVNIPIFISKTYRLLKNGFVITVHT